jgi:hypothetical protein
MNTRASSTPTALLHLLVVGGEGCIGSHMVKHLPSRGCDVITLDKHSTAYRDEVPGNDPSRLAANNAEPRRRFGWERTRPCLKDIVEAWKREEKATSKPTHKTMLIIAKNLYDYRELMVTLAWKNIPLARIICCQPPFSPYGNCHEYLLTRELLP